MRASREREGRKEKGKGRAEKEREKEREEARARASRMGGGENNYGRGGKGQQAGGRSKAWRREVVNEQCLVTCNSLGGKGYK